MGCLGILGGLFVVLVFALAMCSGGGGNNNGNNPYYVPPSGSDGGGGVVFFIILIVGIAVVVWLIVRALKSERRKDGYRRQIMEKYGTQVQKERMAEGLMNLKQETEPIIDKLVFGPLYDAGFVAEDRNLFTTIAKSEVGDDDFMLMKDIRPYVPEGTLQYVKGSASRGIMVTCICHNLKVSKVFRRAPSSGIQSTTAH